MSSSFASNVHYLPVPAPRLAAPDSSYEVVMWTLGEFDPRINSSSSVSLVSMSPIGDYLFHVDGNRYVVVHEDDDAVEANGTDEYDAEDIRTAWLAKSPASRMSVRRSATVEYVNVYELAAA